MAELLKIKREFEEFQKEYYYTNREADENREKENQAVTQIQSWFRGCKVRAYLSHLHKKAIIIQKIWRGFTARARVRQMVKAAYFIMKMNFYEEMVVRIQRTWRGFFVRKYIHNFYARKKYMEGLVMKNELVRRELDQLEDLQKRERDCLDMVKEHTAKVYQAHRLHHLLSTKQCPGVFNSPFRPAPHEMELLLRQQVKYQAPTRLASRGKACLLGIPSSTSSTFPVTLGSPLIKTSRTYSSRPILPPIANKTQQGLYREAGEAWEQRLHCRELMLCLQTSYMHLEEAQNQLRELEPVRLRGTGSTLHHLSHSSSSFPHPAHTGKSFR
ncbi:spermatogenesis-associated protein 17 [Pundamilia nyererei]|uniref:Spermatogenesis-associated protein 17 n=1 Tax=Pundamilia nyererei TaxID=303518 RepID=A0A9Y3VHP2_9CICH|nr:PREDICTED: spermatogenesis-associated protein 17 [Pundamilia nyererei]XP_013766353.1 PREDICTED: spermatogenesis-associated protein 17 [Pundamilia nyererei]